MPYKSAFQYPWAVLALMGGGFSTPFPFPSGRGGSGSLSEQIANGRDMGFQGCQDNGAGRGQP